MSVNRIHYFIRNIFHNSKPVADKFVNNKKKYNMSNKNIYHNMIIKRKFSGYKIPNGPDNNNTLMLLMLTIVLPIIYIDRQLR